MPVRIQRKRVKGWRMPENTVFVGRPTKWGNPYPVEVYGREEAVGKFAESIGNPDSPLRFSLNDIRELKGKNLSCWCRLDEKCHADVLLKLANEPSEIADEN